MQKNILDLLKKLNYISVKPHQDAVVKGLAYDSRDTKPGYIFFALEGEHVDGHYYIEQAINNGAKVVFHRKNIKTGKEGIIYVKVKNTRTALSQAAAWFYENPSHNLVVVGVTGTDGKSTTVWFIQQLLDFLGVAAGFFSTVNYKTRNIVKANPFRQSTPEASQIQAVLKEMVANNKKYAIIEATSHGLSRETARLLHVFFDVAVFTNLSIEHLEFHKSLKNYRRDKANIFRALDTTVEKRDFFTRLPLKQRVFGVVNKQDKNWKYFSNATQKPCYTYGLNNPDTDMSATIIKADLSGSSFTIQAGKQLHKARINLPGIFNVENLLAAVVTVCRLLDIDIAELIRYFPRLSAVQGRMRSIDLGQPFAVIVDFAHTPGSFLKLFKMMRTHTRGRLLVVFGSAGERDKKKRPLQGRIASDYADIIFLTDEDPRGEDRMHILEQVAGGCRHLKRNKNLYLVPDRREAIKQAFSIAQKDDTVLLLGKGHEKSIIQAWGPTTWNEILVAEQMLKELGYSKKEGYGP